MHSHTQIDVDTGLHTLRRQLHDKLSGMCDNRLQVCQTQKPLLTCSVECQLHLAVAQLLHRACTAAASCIVFEHGVAGHGQLAVGSGAQHHLQAGQQDVVGQLGLAAEQPSPNNGLVGKPVCCSNAVLWTTDAAGQPLLLQEAQTLVAVRAASLAVATADVDTVRAPTATEHRQCHSAC